MVAGKRQFMDVAGIMVMPNSLSMSQRPFHVSHHSNNEHCWTSQQWHPAVTDYTTYANYSAGTPVPSQVVEYTYDGEFGGHNTDIGKLDKIP